MLTLFFCTIGGAKVIYLSTDFVYIYNENIFLYAKTTYLHANKAAENGYQITKFA